MKKNNLMKGNYGILVFVVMSLLFSAFAYAATSIELTTGNFINVFGNLNLSGNNLINAGNVSIRGNLSVDGNVSIGNALFVDSLNNKVGINTTNPSETLTVAGTLNVTPAGRNISLFVSSVGDVLIGTTTSANFFPTLQVEGVNPALVLNGPTIGNFFSTDVATDTVDMWFNSTKTLRIGGAINKGGTLFSSVMAINASSGKVGIGMTNPGAKLSITNDPAVTNSIEITDSAASKTFAFTNFGSGNFGLYDKTATVWRWVIDTGGNVGINTTTPSATLSVNGTLLVNPLGVTGLFVNPSGNVGIGTTNPNLNGNSLALTISSGTSGDKDTALDLQGSKTTDGNFLTINGHNGANRIGQINFARDGAVNSGAITFATTNAGSLAEVMRIDKSGNVGIGTTSPTALLQINDSSSDPSRQLSVVGTHATLPRAGIELQTNVGAGYGWLRFNNPTNKWSIQASDNDASGALAFNSALGNPAGATTRLLITPGGNVGINTSTPAFTLDVTGNFRTTGAKTGFLGDIIKNDGDEPLEKGDLVSTSFNGVDENMTGSNIPIFKAMKAKSKNDINIVGVVFEKSPESPKNNQSNNSMISKGEHAIIATQNSITFLKATDENGKILPGDYLTASSKAGYAMKADENSMVLIGRALEPLNSSEGKISAFIQITTSNAISNINEERLIGKDDNEISKIEKEHGIDLGKIKSTKESKLGRIKQRLQLAEVTAPSVTAGVDYMSKVNGSVIIRLGK